MDLPTAATVTDVAGDVGDLSIWDQVAEADVIFHFAAQTSTAAAADDPDRDFHANVTPMRHLLAACRQRGTGSDRVVRRHGHAGRRAIAIARR